MGQVWKGFVVPFDVTSGFVGCIYRIAQMTNNFGFGIAIASVDGDTSKFEGGIDHGL